MNVTWRIGALLNAIQSTFVGLLRVWSVPIVLMLSVASGYTTYYGLAYFITSWIALIVTIAVQSIVVICTLELAGMHWRANPTRYLSVVASLIIALSVSVSFSYFKFYEFSQRDSILIERQTKLEQEVSSYIDSAVGMKSKLVATQQKKVDAIGKEATQAYLGSHPAMQGTHQHQVGRGPFWAHFNEIHQQEKNRLKEMDARFAELDKPLNQVHAAIRDFSMNLQDAVAYDRMIVAFQDLRGASDGLAAAFGVAPVKAPRLGSFAEFSRGVTPSFAMWENLSWFALACAAMVDFFTVLLSYRLEFSAPGPLTEEEKELAYQGLKQFGEFTINHNDELEFVIEKSELERSRRYSDWTRMFAVAFLLNRGYLRKMSERSVEFAPNLYPIIAERMRARQAAANAGEAANESSLHEAMRRKYGV